MASRVVLTSCHFCIACAAITHPSRLDLSILSPSLLVSIFLSALIRDLLMPVWNDSFSSSSSIASPTAINCPALTKATAISSSVFATNPSAAFVIGVMSMLAMDLTITS